MFFAGLAVGILVASVGWIVLLAYLIGKASR